ncbi:Growth hormone-regulated TBC protein 1 [Monoraphidium neglectum]|uniref:Growth hormone-regulated TBC protein 1 n=1 Tax=Monoraphidium neglectum TaxID=145388 RepID=A0A0D2N698_9CHLO|nr:Growth hormone-regulated TBC protein 1 [Monoraphidium neglectum]KIZ01456.1 Growth hormone-regulated TBC protein 1 [Monoraphidium neglectum]|eukprot:XP_013900475.1 Growth hormone-regulated TBC protein 1 [Monoraphidium neglectum]
MSGETGIFDVYGFELTVSAAEKADRYACAEYALRREAKWEPFVKSQCLPEGAKLKRYVRKGVPPVLRGWVWWHTSGAAAHRERGGATHFQRMVEAGERRPCLRQIELDLPRTFPRNTWVPTPEGLAALRSVLVAYSAHNPDVGYCQGMNFLAALLLVAVEKDAERCFWLLVALLEGILYPKTYAPQLDGCHVEMRVLAELLKAKAPKLHRHMEAMGCEVSLFATDWFLVLFATTLPAETAARVWDSVFLEGTKVLFRVALALLIMHQGLLLKKDNPGELLKALKDANLHVHQRDRLMAAAFKDVGSFPMAKIRGGVEPSSGTQVHRLM